MTLTIQLWLNPGALEKIFANFCNVAILSGDNYILERVNITKETATITLSSHGTYLFSINCKTGYCRKWTQVMLTHLISSLLMNFTEVLDFENFLLF